MYNNIGELRDYVARLKIRLDHIVSGDIPETDIVAADETFADYLLNEIEMITDSIEYIYENSITFD